MKVRNHGPSRQLEIGNILLKLVPPLALTRLGNAHDQVLLLSIYKNEVLLGENTIAVHQALASVVFTVQEQD